MKVVIVCALCAFLLIAIFFTLVVMILKVDPQLRSLPEKAILMMRHYESINGHRKTIPVNRDMNEYDHSVPDSRGFRPVYY